MKIAGLLALAGFGLVALLPVLPAADGVASLSITLLLAFLLQPKKKYLLWLLLLSLSIWRGVDWGQQQLENRLAPQFEGVELLLEGYVEGLPHTEEGYQRFDFRAQRAYLADGSRVAAFPDKVRLTAYRAPPLYGGEGRRLRVRLKQPRGFTNPGGFDYELWLFNRGIGGSGYVRGVGEAIEVHTVAAILSRWRERLRQTFIIHIPEPRNLGIALALGLGDRSRIDSDAADSIRRAGLSHLMAISGLHIGLVGGFGFALGRLAGGLLSLWQPLRIFGPYCGIFTACGSAFAYALLSGFGIPAQRALIMLLAWSVWYVSWRRYSSWDSWWLSLVLVLWLQPLAMMEAGFWFSFTAVAVLILLAARHSSLRGAGLRLAIFVQFGLFLLLGVVQLYWGLGISVHAVWVNLIAIPAVSFTIVPLVLMSLLTASLQLPVSSWLLSAVDRLCEWFWKCLNFTDSLIGLSYFRPDFIPGGVVLATASLCLLALLLPLRLPQRVLALLTLCLAVSRTGQAAQDTRITILDVGQGLAVVAESEGSTLVYDTGPRFSQRFNAGDAVLMPYLRSRGISELELLVVSHDDSDHSGGYESLRKNLTLKQTLWGESSNQNSAERKLCNQSLQWQLGRIRVHLLTLGVPVPGWNANNRSCVLLLDIDGYRILLPGDIERQREQRLLQHPLLQRPVDLMVAPHHGSKTSSSVEWVARLQPQVTVFSAAYRSRYRHPHPLVLQRYRKIGSSSLCSSATGALLLDFHHPEAPVLLAWRSHKRRYWRFVSSPDCRH